VTVFKRWILHTHGLSTSKALGLLFVTLSAMGHFGGVSRYFPTLFCLFPLCHFAKISVLLMKAIRPHTPDALQYHAIWWILTWMSVIDG